MDRASTHREQEDPVTRNEIFQQNLVLPQHSLNFFGPHSAQSEQLRPRRILRGCSLDERSILTLRRGDPRRKRAERSIVQASLLSRSSPCLLEMRDQLIYLPEEQLSLNGVTRRLWKCGHAGARLRKVLDERATASSVRDLERVLRAPPSQQRDHLVGVDRRSR